MNQILSIKGKHLPSYELETCLSLIGEHFPQSDQTHKVNPQVRTITMIQFALKRSTLYVEYSHAQKELILIF